MRWSPLKDRARLRSEQLRQIRGRMQIKLNPRASAYESLKTPGRAASTRGYIVTMRMQR